MVTPHDIFRAVRSDTGVLPDIKFIDSTGHLELVRSRLGITAGLLFHFEDYKLWIQ